MNAVNPVQLIILLWTFTALCQADDEMSVNCEDVTGTVSEEVTLTCGISLKKTLKCSEHCIKLYKFQYTEKYNDSEICREEFSPGSCEQRNSFTCRFTPTTVMTGQFRFFITTECGWKVTEFTVNITETSKHEPVTEDPEPTLRAGDGPESTTGENATIIGSVVGCFIIIIITMTIICKRTSIDLSRVRRIPVCLGLRHNDENSRYP
ncbi:uncharacterized protein LOC120474787 [Pimephales promelas]|uniref:uncharacterized protein LOC120474787 n=1 Tax=Pimephales promelas TaxID=90988 RepID=UPI0019559C8F|nr:uncharacterized protein LOC120474787 [Pimephales promelas]XP_039521349.1 uncharacterized protein LOC120474787 [Pimephales promelas]